MITDNMQSIGQTKCEHKSWYLGTTQKVTTPEINDQIHELILEDRRISAKSIARRKN